MTTARLRRLLREEPERAALAFVRHIARRPVRRLAADLTADERIALRNALFVLVSCEHDAVH